MTKIEGLTLIELLLMIALLAVIAGVTTPILGRTLLSFQVQSSEDRVLGALYKAQVYSMHHRLGAQWGVCVSGGNLRLFAGSCASPTYAENWPVPSGVTISGLSSVTYGIYRGEPSSTPTISIVSDLGTRQISINRIGGLDVN